MQKHPIPGLTKARDVESPALTVRSLASRSSRGAVQSLS